MTANQVDAWFATANTTLERLRGAFDFWGQATPIPVQFCDGHGIHRADLQGLQQALIEARDLLLSRSFGEDGPAFGVSAQQAFIEICAIIANAKRVDDQNERTDNLAG